MNPIAAGDEATERTKRRLAAALAAGMAVLLVAILVTVTARPHSGAASPAPAPRRPADPYRGLGAWVDMYSWSETFTGGTPTFDAAGIDAMAAAGVQTLYLQAASQTGPATTLEASRLDSLVSRAHHLGLSVVVWYQPTLVNVPDDLARLTAIARLPADGVAVDIESTQVADVSARNAALVTLSGRLRRALPRRRLGAVVLPATFLEVVNPRYWPDFPYLALAPSFDAWLPMVYWTNRLTSSGFRNGYTYTADSVARLRADLGARSTAVISPIGGVSVDGVALSDLTGFVTAAKRSRSAGGSLYEWPGTSPADWSVLRALRT